MDDRQSHSIRASTALVQGTTRGGLEKAPGLWRISSPTVCSSNLIEQTETRM